MTVATKKTIDELIKEKGLKKVFVAGRMGISTSYLWRLINNPQKMRISQIEELSNILNVDISDIELKKI
ncbi:helix-turn-helix domain-containing protein [Listeria monocytogenes]|uniref:helix-turn-helix domain-containing protein n=1 Tax=Listeria monocytogenes TaxID=1639 RepID=UPI0015E76B4E|nr:helix-turn-helix transcriptional regulator [Listeria monocytogenes]